MHNNQKVIVWSAKMTKKKSALPLGHFSPSDNDGRVYVTVKNGELLKLLRVQMDGQPERWAEEVLL